MTYEPTLWAYSPRGDDPHAIRLALDDYEQKMFDDLPGGPSDESAEVTDQNTGYIYEVSRASCGGGCHCAALAVLVEMPQRD